MDAPTSIYKHLHPDTIPLLALPKEQRIEVVNTFHFQSSPAIKAAIEQIETVIEQGLGPRRRNVKLIAESGMGKTKIIAEVRSKYPPRPMSGTGGFSMPVAVYVMTAIENRDMFCAELEEVVGIPPPVGKERKDYRKRILLVTKLLKSAGCIFAVFDEFQDLLLIPDRERKGIVQLIKVMANGGDFPMCVAGSSDSITVIDDDSHMRTRFRLKVERKPWEDNGDFHTFLFGVVRRFPLEKPSLIFDEDSRKKIIGNSGGNTEVIVAALQRGAVLGLKDGSERIERQVLFDLLLA